MTAGMAKTDSLTLIRGLLDAEAQRDASGILARLTSDFSEEYPQSGERIAGPANAVAAALADPNPLILESPRMTPCGESLVLVEARVAGATEQPWVVSLYELSGALVQRRTTYLAAPFAAPAWRARWVEAIPNDPTSLGAEAGTEVEHSLVQRYARALAANDLERLGQMRHAEWVADLPQSGERFRGHAAVVGADRDYPGGLPTGAEQHLRGADDRWALTPSYVPLRIDGRGLHWVSESELTYATGEQVHGVALLTFRDGKAIAERWYYCAALEPAAWRRPWTQG